MKKAFAFVLAIWAMACIIGCSPDEAMATTEPGFRISGANFDLTLDAPAEPILDALGEPKSYTEAASCAFEGLDKTYYYGSFYLTTYPAGDGDRISSVWFADDTVSTEEGIAIGASREEVEQAYGSDCFGDTNACTITRGNATLTIALKENVVSTIRYDAILE